MCWAQLQWTGPGPSGRAVHSHKPALPAVSAPRSQNPPKKNLKNARMSTGDNIQPDLLQGRWPGPALRPLALGTQQFWEVPEEHSVVSGPPARDECPGRTLQGRASSLEECDCPDCPPPGFRPQAPRLGGGRHVCDHPSLTLPESQSRSMMAANPPPSTCGTSTARGGCYLGLPGSGFPASPSSAASFPSCGSSRQSPAAQGYWAGWAGRWRH